ISLSGLLNVIDGAAAQEGRVLIMTSNHRQQLESALLRAARVDFSIHFELATFETAADIFAKGFSCNNSPYHATKQSTSKEVNNEISNDNILSLARSFRRKLPERTFSPAEIQGLLLRYPGDLNGAISATKGWVITTLADRKAQQNK
ncbi:uncharacterized protein A1O9_01691, partial [Exophiala aquamarina CBS 119918]